MFYPEECSMCTREEYVFYCCDGVFYSGMLVLFKTFISTLIFCLVSLSIIESLMLKSPAITVELYISPFNSLSDFASYILSLCCYGHIIL